MMNLLEKFKRYTLPLGFSACAFLAANSVATEVEVRTDAGNFTINLFDFDPDVRATVDNFLAYANAGLYDDTFFHRLAAGFVLQGGGYTYGGVFPAPQDADLNLQEVLLVPGQTNPTVTNQPKYSNVRGTIAMAKLGTDPNSATNQWFINLANNGSNLDIQNQGFTVFGVVTSGMDVVDTLAGFSLLAPSYGSPLEELPIQNYTSDDFANNVVPNQNNLAIINEVVLVPGTTVDSAADLDIVANELIQGFPSQPLTPRPDHQDGGSVSLVFLSLLSALLFVRRRYQK